MKKHILAASVAALVGAPAFAQVTIKGNLDVSVSSVSKTGGRAAGTTTNADGTSTSAKEPVSRTNVINNFWATSNLSMGGTEDLGGGMKAFFALNSNIAADDSRSLSIGDRGALVGLSGGFGTIKVGKLDSTVGSSLQTATGLGNFAGLDGANIALNGRPSNAIYYQTPSFNGVSLEIAKGYGNENTTETTKKGGEHTSLAARGNIGPVSFMVYTSRDTVNADAVTGKACKVFAQNTSLTGATPVVGGTVFTYNGTSTSGCSAFGTGVTAPISWNAAGVTAPAGVTGTLQYTALIQEATVGSVALDGKLKRNGIALAYDAGVAQIAYNMITVKSEGSAVLGSATTSSGVATSQATTVDARAQGLHIKFPVGQLTPFMSYREYEDKVSPTKDYDVSMVGATYSLSKRTMGFIAHQKVDNSSAAVGGVYGATAPRAGYKPSATTVGITHSF
jgi:predicted porin